MAGIDYIRPRIISSGYRYGHRQRQVTSGAGETEVAMARMLNNKEASQELPLNYFTYCPTAKYYTSIYYIVDK